MIYGNGEVHIVKPTFDAKLLKTGVGARQIRASSDLARAKSFFFSSWDFYGKLSKVFKKLERPKL